MAVTAAPQQGHSISISFETGFFAWIIDVQPAKMSRAALETTNSATTTQRTYRPEQLYTNGEMSVALQFNAATTPPIGSAASTCTITFPMAQGAVSATTWAGSAFLTRYEPQVPINGIMTANCVVQWAGAITITPAS